MKHLKKLLDLAVFFAAVSIDVQATKSVDTSKDSYTTYEDHLDFLDNPETLQLKIRTFDDDVKEALKITNLSPENVTLTAEINDFIFR
jgi:hypothetical protein